MKKLELKNATASLAEYARDLHEPIVLTANGKPAAALVPIENADAETVSLSSNPLFIALIERSRSRQNAEGGIPSAEMRERLGVKERPRGSRSPTPQASQPRSRPRKAAAGRKTKIKAR